MDNLFAQLEKESPSQMEARVAPGQDLTEAAMATFLYDKLVAEKAELTTYKDAHKIKVDAGLVTLKRSVALVRHGLRMTARSMLECMFDEFQWSQAEVAEEAAASSVRLSHRISPPSARGVVSFAAEGLRIISSTLASIASPKVPAAGGPLKLLCCSSEKLAAKVLPPITGLVASERRASFDCSRNRVVCGGSRWCRTA